MAHEYLKTGYLHEHYRIFHIKDLPGRDFELHYHDFHKFLILLKGSINYSIEGRQYELLPGDIILVPAGQIHRPIFHNNLEYERLILYVSDDFFTNWKEQGSDLTRVFDLCIQNRSNLLRFNGTAAEEVQKVCQKLVFSLTDDQYESKLYQRIKLIELLILLSRYAQNTTSELRSVTDASPVVCSAIEYINLHLKEEDLSIDRVAAYCYVTRSYLMHLFKKETGSSVGNYITDKRLFLTNSYIKKGYNILDACLESGFRNYSAYYHARSKKGNTIL